MAARLEVARFGRVLLGSGQREGMTASEVQAGTAVGSVELRGFGSASAEWHPSVAGSALVSFASSQTVVQTGARVDVAGGSCALVLGAGRSGLVQPSNAAAGADCLTPGSCALAQPYVTAPAASSAE
mmetsp:Transcript_25970/g.47468  ORF Transcript_25970/g.47468 Transcript_25970/m.47468 type:complete len:127 (+) Transcript_25970:45-425(+)